MINFIKCFFLCLLRCSYDSYPSFFWYDVLCLLICVSLQAWHKSHLIMVNDFLIFYWIWFASVLLIIFAYMCSLGVFSFFLFLSYPSSGQQSLGGGHGFCLGSDTEDTPSARGPCGCPALEHSSPRGPGGRPVFFILICPCLVLESR